MKAMFAYKDKLYAIQGVTENLYFFRSTFPTCSCWSPDDKQKQQILSSQIFLFKAAADVCAVNNGVVVGVAFCFGGTESFYLGLVDQDAAVVLDQAAVQTLDDTLTAPQVSLSNSPICSLIILALYSPRIP